MKGIQRKKCLDSLKDAEARKQTLVFNTEENEDEVSCLRDVDAKKKVFRASADARRW